LRQVKAADENEVKTQPGAQKFQNARDALASRGRLRGQAEALAVKPARLGGFVRVAPERAHRGEVCHESGVAICHGPGPR
jgi:hypothetical protein